MQRKALITGITGQDGSFLAELLLGKGYLVYGLMRRISQIQGMRIAHLMKEFHDKDCRFFLKYGDMCDAASLGQLLGEIQPDEIYNLAAQSHVRISFDQPEYTTEVTGTGTLRLLAAIRNYIRETRKAIRFYQASSSEMFGSSLPPQSERTAFHPRSPYAIAKVFAFWQTVNYREAYGLHSSNGILFNHESERRGENFVTRKITLAAGRIKMGLQQKLYLGNLDAQRDWGYAKDYVEAMWLMLQQDQPDDYVIATGQSHSVQEFVEQTFGMLKLKWRNFVSLDSYYRRPAEVDHLCGDATKARRVLNWQPKVSFEQLVRIMTEHDLELAEREAHARGFKRTTFVTGTARTSKKHQRTSRS